MKSVEATAGVSAAVVQPAKVGRASPGDEVAQARIKAQTVESGRDAIPEREQEVLLREFGALNARKEAMGQVATEVRGVGEARDMLARAKTQLEQVVKSFPPFPPGSLEREQYLSSVAGIRSMIEQLTIPREPLNQLNEALGQRALINSEVSDELLNSGLEGLTRADSVLAAVQADMAKSAAPAKESEADEAYYVVQSKRVGAALAQQGVAISRSPEAVLALLA
jgi:hypothetical protein